MTTGDAPQWPADLLYLPVAPNGKGPDVHALPGTWDTDGTGCTPHADCTDRRWGIVDTARDGWRLLTVDLDVHKMDADRAERVQAPLADGPPTRVHTSQSGGRHVFYWVPTDALTDDGTCPVTFGEHIDDKLNGYVLSPHCDGYTVTADREPAVCRDPTTLPDAWLDRDTTTDTGATDTDQPLDGVYDVLARASYPEGERVSHPFHGSDTGTNFMVDDGGETWRCWRHDCTGNAGHLLGIEQGVLDCGEWVPGGLDAATWRDIYDAARADGYDIPGPQGATESPDVRAVWQQHESDITDAGPVARLDAAEPVFREMARAELRDDTDDVTEAWLAELGAIDRDVPKTQLRERYETVRAAVREDLSDDVLADDTTPLDAWLNTHVERVVVITSEDTHADATYQWRLTDGRQFATEGSTHFRWQDFRTLLFDALGVWPDQPEPADLAKWRDWVAAFITDRREDKTGPSPRTHAIEELKNYIREATAYPSLDAAINDGADPDRAGGGVAVMPDGPDGTEIRILNDALATDHPRCSGILDNSPVGMRGFYAALNAQNAVIRPARTYTLSDGRTKRCWHLNADALDVRPARYKDADDVADDEERVTDPFGTDDTDAT